MYEAVGNAEVIGVRVYDSFNNALEGEKSCEAFGLNRFWDQSARLSCRG